MIVLGIVGFMILGPVGMLIGVVAAGFLSCR